MFDEYMDPPRVEKPVSPPPAVPVTVNSAGTPSSTTIDQDAPSPSHSSSSLALQYPSIHQGITAESTLVEENLFAPIDNDPFINIFVPELTSEASSSEDVSSAESTYVTQTLHNLGKWSKDHPLDNVIGNPSRLVSTRKQLATDALWCLYNSVLSKVEPKNFKSAITEDCWFQAKQDEIHEFDRIQHSKSKNIDIRHHLFESRFDKGVLNYLHRSMDFQLADNFTNAYQESGSNFLLQRRAFDVYVSNTLIRLQEGEVVLKHVLPLLCNM
ncbi:hypothetical protein Tco_0614692 [Tanacetum coccineum]